MLRCSCGRPIPASKAVRTQGTIVFRSFSCPGFKCTKSINTAQIIGEVAETKIKDMSEFLDKYRPVIVDVDDIPEVPFEIEVPIVSE